MAYQCFNYKCLPPFSLSQVIYQPFPIHSHSCYHINKDTLQKASDTAEHLLLSPLVLRGKVRRQTAHFHKQSVHLQHFPCSVVLSCLCLYPIGNNKSSPSFLRSKSFAFLYIYSVSISVKKKKEQTGQTLTPTTSYSKFPQDSSLIMFLRGKKAVCLASRMTAACQGCKTEV